MTASNHTATGMAIMALVPHPVMLPVAFLSHYALDAMPHFGGEHTTRTFIKILFVDMGVAAALLLTVLLRRPLHWEMIMAGGILAASPDLMWMGPFLDDLRKRQPKTFGVFRRFHGWIQWGERPWGMLIEFVWLAGMLAVLIAARTL